MLQAARTGKPKSLGSVAKRTTSAILDHLLGWKQRFVLGGMLLLGCAMWANQNGLLSKDKITELKNTATDLAQRDLTNTELTELSDTGAQLGKLVTMERARDRRRTGWCCLASAGWHGRHHRPMGSPRPRTDGRSESWCFATHPTSNSAG